MALESQGFRVEEAADASAVVKVAAPGIDLVVLDINMPGGTVHDTVSALRRQQPQLPILVLSGVQTAPDNLPVELMDFARKPIELDDLVSRVRWLLEQAATSQS